MQTSVNRGSFQSIHYAIFLARTVNILATRCALGSEELSLSFLSIAMRIRERGPPL